MIKDFSQSVLGFQRFCLKSPLQSYLQCEYPSLHSAESCNLHIRIPLGQSDFSSDSPCYDIAGAFIKKLKSVIDYMKPLSEAYKLGSESPRAPKKVQQISPKGRTNFD